MVKANELRVGNWIKHGESPSSFEYPDTIFQVSIDLFFEIARSRISDYHLEPISLTPEILEQCGFELFPWGYVKKSTKDFGVRINVHSFSYDVSGNNPVQIKYLHQLQNLYFALTNEELIFQSIKELK